MDIIAFLHGFLKVLSLLGTVGTCLYIYKLLYIAIGLVKTRTFPATERRFRYAIVIAARNESSVLGALLDSIHKQDYPPELISIFVVADNCTDNTAEIARCCGAVCYERFDQVHRTKGFALEFLFQRIEENYGISSFDGYFVFDADNLLKSDYISRMNESFAAGEKIITAYRNTKNFGDNWISASYALHWLRTIRSEHRARSVLQLATRIQGTGMLISSELLRDGWHYTSLTEDRALSADAVVRGFRISYNDAAEFFDEQPTSIKVAMRQRVRWAKGHIQAYSESGKKLLFNAIGRRSFMSWDMLLTIFPRSLVSAVRKLLSQLINIALLILGVSSVDGWQGFLIGSVLAIGKSWLTKSIQAVYVFIAERKRIQPLPWIKKIFFCMTFPIFDIIGKVAMCIAAVTKVEWKPIPHNRALGIDELSGVDRNPVQER